MSCLSPSLKEIKSLRDVAGLQNVGALWKNDPNDQEQFHENSSVEKKKNHMIFAKKGNCLLATFNLLPAILSSRRQLPQVITVN